MHGDRDGQGLPDRRGRCDEGGAVKLGRSPSIAAAIGAALVLAGAGSAPAATGRVARASGSSATGACSKAVADQLLKQYQVGPNWPGRHPAGQVLCGAFTGPQSKAMAVSYALGVCMPYLGWGVFRFTGGRWRLVMTHDSGYVTLAAVGSDIGETVPVYLPGDGRCFPNGGTESRRWPGTVPVSSRPCGS
jgi:hypothetical protein